MYKSRGETHQSPIPRPPRVETTATSDRPPQAKLPATWADAETVEEPRGGSLAAPLLGGGGGSSGRPLPGTPERKASKPPVEAGQVSSQAFRGSQLQSFRTSSAGACKN